MNVDRAATRNFPKTWTNKKMKLREIINRFDSVYIENLCMFDLIKKWDNKHTMFYIDPPYPNTDCDGYYENKFSIEDLFRLYDLLDTIAGSYILSGFDVGKHPRSACIRIDKTLTSTMAANKKQPEILLIKTSGIINPDVFFGDEFTYLY